MHAPYRYVFVCSQLSDTQMRCLIRPACQLIRPLYLPPNIKLKDLLEHGVPVVEFYQEPPLRPIRGIVVYAPNCNGPPGCYRLCRPSR